MKKISIVISLLLCSVAMMAKPARPGFFNYTQPDGTVIRIQRHGDEWGHWTTNSQGQVVRQDADGFFRVVEEMDTKTAAQLAKIRRNAKKQAMLQAPAKASLATGQKHFLLLLVEFSDVSFTISNPQETIDAALNQEGYSLHGAIGSARDYYYQNSDGSFEPIFDVYGPIKLDKKVSYYGGNDSYGNDTKPEVAVRDAILKLDDSAINFADYDIDKDGYIDLVYMVYAGKGEADGGSEDTIWPHQYYLYSGAGLNVVRDGKRFDRYACGSELNGDGHQDGIGTICHEFGHAIGLPDFYDADYDDNGTARTLLEYSLMDSGSYNNNGWTPPYLNIVERIMLGWLDESVLKEFPANGDYELLSVDNEVAYKTPTDMAGEYFVYECRKKEGWDKYIPSAGLIVYHVDQSSRKVSILDLDGRKVQVAASELWSDWISTNSINENGKHPCFYVVAAASPYSVSYGMQYYSGYGTFFNSSYYPRLPFPGSSNVKTFTPRSWNGTDGEITLSNIAFSGSKVTFTVSGVSGFELEYPYISNPGKGSYSAGSSFALTLNTPGGYGTVSSVSWTLDGKVVSGSSVSLTSGHHTVEASVTLESGKKDIVSLELDAN